MRIEYVRVAVKVISGKGWPTKQQTKAGIEKLLVGDIKKDWGKLPRSLLLSAQKIFVKI